MRRVLLGSGAQQALRSAPPEAKKKLKAALHRLKAEGPAAKSLDVRLLRQALGAAPVFRLKVGTWRIAFRLHGKDLQVVRVFPRRDGYGWLERLG